MAAAAAAVHKVLGVGHTKRGYTTFAQLVPGLVAAHDEAAVDRTSAEPFAAASVEIGRCVVQEEKPESETTRVAG